MTDAGAGAAVHIEAPARVRGLVLVDGGHVLCGMLAGMRLARWSCADGRFLHEVSYRGPEVSAAALARKGDRVAVGTAQGAVRLLDATTLAVLAEVRPPPSPRAALAFSGDGGLLAGFARGRHLDITVWNAATGARLCTFAQPTEEPAGMAFHPSGRSAALAVLTGDILLLDLASGRPTRTLADARMASEALAFTPDGQALVAASYDGALQIWDTASWRVRRHAAVRGANALAISPDGARAAVSRSSYNPEDTPAEVRVVDLRTGAVLRSASLGIASTTDVAFTGPDRLRVASARASAIAVHEIG